jgi:hypothetical protein
VQDRKRLRVRFGKLLWRPANAIAEVKWAADGVRTSILGFALKWSGVVTVSEWATR